MASAAKRANGNWLGRYRGPDGKERTKQFTTKRDAQEWARKQESNVRTMDWTDPARARITVAELAEQFMRAHEVKPKTRASYQSALNAQVLPAWGSTRLDQITLSGVKSWVTNMTGQNGKPLSPSRRRAAYNVLCLALDVAVQDQRLPRNPARPKPGQGRRSGFLPKPSPPRRHRYLTHHDVHRLAEACGADADMVLVMAYSGLRWGELAALRVDDVDELRGRLRVDENLVDVSGHLSFGTPKSHAIRSVPLPAFLRDRLAQLIEGKTSRSLLFTTPSGTPLRSSNWRRRVFDAAVETAGLGPLTPHSLRHTAASLAVASGANVKSIQRMLGHEDASLTLNTYADLFDDDLDRLAERVDQAVSEARADLLRTSAPVVGLPTTPPGQAQGL